MSLEVQPTPQNGEYVAKECKPQEDYVANEYKLHHKQVSVWPSSKNYTTSWWVCGRAVHATPQEGECVTKEYKLLYGCWAPVLVLKKELTSCYIFITLLQYRMPSSKVVVALIVFFCIM
jgi:hypothetical protein